jgi:glycerol uptake facilitator-like aquaporin
VAEFFGTALLVCVVVGSGIMGMKLSNDTGIALLINTVSTILALALIIYTLTPLSGAHLNPVVTLVELFSGKISPVQVFSYVVAQMMGAVSGAILANTMFDLSPIQISTKARDSLGMLIGEVIATAGLIIVIGVLSSRGQAKLVPLGVSSWIGSAYLFTSSTSFANPAVTVGRIFSDTFSGIEPGSVLNFIVAQLVGAGVGLLAVRSLAKA